MVRGIILLFLSALPWMASAQSYKEELQAWRDDYGQGLLRGRHPLKEADLQYLRFYDSDPEYVVKAEFVQSPGVKPFLLHNMNGGIEKAVKTYGYVYFNLQGASLKLWVYRFLDAQGNEQGGLFIPFTDRTNYKETFQGGRYLDVSPDEVIQGKVTLDFNKCYNPHTAYEMGYPYIIPPRVNSLKIEIRAGEKIFGYNPGY